MAGRLRDDYSHPLCEAPSSGVKGCLGASISAPFEGRKLFMENSRSMNSYPHIYSICGDRNAQSLLDLLAHCAGMLRLICNSLLSFFGMKSDPFIRAGFFRLTLRCNNIAASNRFKPPVCMGKAYTLLLCLFVLSARRDRKNGQHFSRHILAQIPSYTPELASAEKIKGDDDPLLKFNYHLSERGFFDTGCFQSGNNHLAHFVGHNNSGLHTPECISNRFITIERLNTSSLKFIMRRMSFSVLPSALQKSGKGTAQVFKMRGV